MAPHEWLARWNFDPVILFALAVAAIAYQHWPGRRRGDSSWAWSGLGLALFLYVSPFCAAGSSLFSVRVVHHLLLALALAPIAARLLGGALARIPGGLAAWTIGAAIAMWVWHAPLPYHWAATDGVGYWLMQTSIFVTALLFWSRTATASGPAAVAALLGAMVAMGALGALITLAPALYPAHFGTTAAWGLAPLEDQQVGGLIMWAPASAIYLFVALRRIRAMVASPAAT